MKQVLVFISSMVILSIIIWGCGKEPKTPLEVEQSPSVNSCEGCHTNYAHLKKVYTPDTAAAPGGCGGETPHIEPYDRVYLGGEGYKAFKASTHGKIPCTSCHNGVDNTGDKKLAHSNNFIKHPSDYAVEKCGSCHASIVSKAHNNIHKGWGQKSMLLLRYGLVYTNANEIETKFNQLPTRLKEGYNQNCARCHAGCGDCHVNRPAAGGGGLLNGHKFDKPHMTNQCTICHSSRGAHAFFGIAPGTSPDVHQTKGMTCTTCHKATELHGDGKVYDQRYKVSLLPKCEDCHKGMATKNIYHQVHIDDMNCQTCHSQNYNNCGSCHVGGQGARISSYQSFKIGMNPIQETKPFKFATLRRAVMAPDSWELYGVSQLPNFNVRPTYKYTTPHNIQKWTSRTRVAQGRPCFDNCHIIREGNILRNKELYLFNSDLLDWEKEANRTVVVDGKLPASWGIGN